MTLQEPSALAHADIFVGDSDMAQRMRAHDWAATSLGPPEHWPNALKVALRILLTSKFEMWLGWGPDIAFFYNDAYRPTLGIKHPGALGQPTRVLWAEIWEDIRGRIEGVYGQGVSSWDRGMLLLLERSGYPEETYHTFSYSPLLGDGGRVEGLFCAVSEETDRVINERRLDALRELAGGLAVADSRAVVLGAARHALDRAGRDVPFSLLYLLDDSGSAVLSATTGLPEGHRLAVPRLTPGTSAPWALDAILAGQVEVRLPLAPDADVPTGPWTVPPPSVLVVALPAQGGAQPSGLLVVGTNPYKPVNPAYTGFIRLLTGQIASAIANADTYEAERQRSTELAQAVRLRQEAAEMLRVANTTLAQEVQARTAERDRFAVLFKAAPSFMCVLRGPHHIFELQNESYLQLVGHRDVAGKALKEALPEVATQGFITLLDEVYASGEPVVGRGVKVMLQREPGAPLEDRYVNFVYEPIRGPDGVVEGIFVDGHDVTEQMRAQEELRALNEGLEARVAERTHALEAALEQLRAESREREAAQEALRHAQKMEAVGQLTGGIAHDFNNLLQGITGSLDLLRLRLQLGRTENIDKVIAGAMASAQRAAGLTHRLLAFSRRQPLDPKPVKANQLIAPMEELLRRTMGENITIELVLAGGLWTSLCDASQLESAILNLCINARDAMPDGGTLTVETSNAVLDEMYASQVQDVKPGQYICISVSDTGTGMAESVLAKVFDPFYTTKPLGQGTGLGLSMIYGFAKQSEGHIRLYSELGQGTTARLYLPRHYGAAAPPEAIPQIRNEHHTQEGETILVVEDEPVVRSLVVEVLAGLGYRTIEAADGGTALRILQGSQPIDLLVTDVGLPQMNGRQVYDAARVTRPGLRVLFMTGYAENATLANGFLEPGMEMITKPFAMEKLATKIVRMLKPDDEPGR